MRSIWSRICNSRISTFYRKTPSLKYVGLGLDLLENRLAPAAMVGLDASGNLMIQDIVGAPTNDNVTIKSDTTNNLFIISDPTNTINTSIAGATGDGTNTVTVPFDSVIGSAIFVNTFAGDDLLTVDLSLGNFATTVTYDGGTNGSRRRDEAARRRRLSNVTHTFASASAGSVAVTGTAISYSGLSR